MLRLIPLICGLIGLLAAFSFYSWVNRIGLTKKEQRIAGEYSNNETKLIFEKDWMTIIVVVAVICVAIGISINWISAGLYLFGSIVSLAVEYVAIRMLTRGKYKYSTSEEDGNVLFKISFRTGAGIGLFVVSVGLLATTLVFVPFNVSTVIQNIACFAFGASTIVLFADIKYSPIGDLLESFLGSVISVIVLSNVAINTSNVTATFSLSTVSSFPIIIAGIGIVASSIGMLLVRIGKRGNLVSRINMATYISSILVAVASFFLSISLLQSYSYSIAIIIGILCGLITGITSVKSASFIPGLIFAVAFVVSYNFVGPYGAALTSIGFLSISAVLIALAAFVSVVENDKVANRVSNGFSSCASALTVLALFVAYTSVAEVSSISITEPLVLACLLIGVMMPLIYATLFSRSIENDVNYDFIMKLLAIFVPGVIGIFLGPEALGGLLGGLITTGLITSFVLSNSSSNTVSDNYSNTMSTSINTLIKYMTAFSLVFAPLFIKFGSFFF